MLLSELPAKQKTPPENFLQWGGWVRSLKMETRKLRANERQRNYIFKSSSSFTKPLSVFS